jgi:hypothetical protein
VRISLRKPIVLRFYQNTGDDIHDYPLMQHPAQPAAIVALYFVFVFSLGPKLMKNRQAFDLRKIMTIYNITQILFNLVVFVMVSCLVGVIDCSSVVCLRPPKLSKTLVCTAVPQIIQTLLWTFRLGKSITTTAF